MDLPSLSTLGFDLLDIKVWGRVKAVVRPFLFIGLYFVAFESGYYVVLPLITFFLFVSVISVTHDLVHGTLGFSKVWNDRLLSFFGCLILESGHSYKKTHLIHHKNFPSKIDKEGEPAKRGFLYSLLIGPIYIPQLYYWSIKHTQKGTLKNWLYVEGAFFVWYSLSAIYLFPVLPIVFWYGVSVVFGGWFYPLITVYMPHRMCGDNPLHSTILYSGNISRWLFLNLIYHFEHHYYPQVPTENLSRLAHRLKPFYEKNRGCFIERKLF